MYKHVIVLPHVSAFFLPSSVRYLTKKT